MKKQVSSEEFYKVIGPLDVTLSFANDTYPYKTIFKMRWGDIVGWQDTDGKYYLKDQSAEHANAIN